MQGSCGSPPARELHLVKTRPTPVLHRMAGAAGEHHHVMRLRDLDPVVILSRSRDRFHPIRQVLGDVLGDVPPTWAGEPQRKLLPGSVGRVLAGKSGRLERAQGSKRICEEAGAYALADAREGRSRLRHRRQR